MTKHMTMAAGVKEPDPSESPPILVVDDSRAQRLLLAASLRRHGFTVYEADCGEAALELCRKHRLRLVLSDWVMPGMSGPELCHALRSAPDTDYVYFILLTSKSERAEIAEGLERGADDFLSKPVNGDELRARLKAGIRIIEMQQELREKNRLIGDTLSELQHLYDMIEADLREARKLQQALVRDRYMDFGSAQASLMLHSSGHVGGDLVGFFRASPTQVGLYSIDVSGHGISSALMTARLAGYLHTESPSHNIALAHTVADFYRVLPPNETVARFNDLMFSVISTELYFTIAFAIFNLETGVVSLTQAGHPHPMVQRADGTIELLCDGGLPVGLIEGAEYDRVQVQLHPGDRLFLCSDGITECPDPEGHLLEEDGLGRILSRHHDEKGLELLKVVMTELGDFAQGAPFPDDISAVVFEYQGPQPPKIA